MYQKFLRPRMRERVFKTFGYQYDFMKGELKIKSFAYSKYGLNCTNTEIRKVVCVCVCVCVSA